MKSSTSFLPRIDRFGASASLMCAVHCALVPFAATLLPLLGLGFLADKRVENGFLLISFILAGASICWGIRVHGQRRLLVIFASALLLIAVGHGVMDGRMETIMVIGGALMVACGHFLNHRLCNACRNCAESETDILKAVEPRV